MVLLSWFGGLRATTFSWITKHWSWGETVFSADPTLESVESAPEMSSSNQTLEGNTSSEVLPYPQSTYPIFLSHSGAQKSFVEQLYTDFKDENQFPFFDISSHSLKKGEIFPPQILKAARECKVAIIILTEEFLTSKWPMMELLTFIGAQKSDNPELKLFPVLLNGLDFKDLEEGRWEREWLNLILQENSRKRSPRLTLGDCKEALQKLRKVNGLDSKKFPKSEKKLRMAIVEGTLKLLAPTPDIDTCDIQGIDRICEVLSGMFRNSAIHSNGVQHLGLYGMGGLGKTTMCRALYSHLWSKFRHKVCHVDLGINEPDKAQRKLERQKELLTRFTTMRKRAIGNIKDSSTAKKYMKQQLEKVPVFLAVDNVQDNEASREEAREYLECISCAGTMILVTSRSREILQDVLPDPACCKPIPTLTEEESMKLFLKVAVPKVELSSLSEEQFQIIRSICAQYCFFSYQEGAGHDNGETSLEGYKPMAGTSTYTTPGTYNNGHYHPLALQAVASFLHDRYLDNRSILRWKKTLLLHHSRESNNIFTILGLGFDSLCDKAKQLFIDVALFASASLSTNELFNWLVAIHGGSDYDRITTELSALQRRSVLSYEVDGSITIHELYKEFAKKYVTGDQHPAFGIYLEDANIIACPDWLVVPRVSLFNCSLPIYLRQVEMWTNVVVVHLVCSKGLQNLSIGDLVNLRHLVVIECPQLEVISWIQHMVCSGGDQPVPEGARKSEWGKHLCFVEFSLNKSLKIVPDFSQCLNLQKLWVDNCSLEKPLILRSCSALESLQGEVQILQSCPKLKSARLAWNASHRDLPNLKDLPSLQELRIERSGPPVVDQTLFRLQPQGWIQEHFLHQLFPKETEDLDLPDMSRLTNLQTLHLHELPIGKLPAGLEKMGSNLQLLNLTGCLLSQLVDFSPLLNLRKLTFARTNVKEVRGVGRLTKLEWLDCRFCFRLQKLPDLWHLSKLEFLSIACCSKLKAVPRLPREYHHDDEFQKRLYHAVTMFAHGLSGSCLSTLPGWQTNVDCSELGSQIWNFKTGNIKSVQPSSEMIHTSIRCDGCRQVPIIGPRYKAKTEFNDIDICGSCLTSDCDKSKCQVRGAVRFAMKILSGNHYNLCLKCYNEHGCKAKNLEFCRIDKTEQ